MAAALPFIAAGASIAQGVAGLKAGEKNRNRAYAAAREKRGAAAAQGRRVREVARRKDGQLLASLAGNGLQGASSGGTALDLLQESQLEAALDVMELRRQGHFEARALEQQGDDARRQGRFALLQGVLGAGSSYLGMKSDWAQARAGEGG